MFWGGVFNLSKINMTMEKHKCTRISKLLSLALRHKPEQLGLELDRSGWADVGLLLQRLAAVGLPLSREELESLVRENNKQRFRFSGDGQRIRANQGHSIPVDLQLEQLEPPSVLFHGTALRNLGPIQEKGLCRQQRQHVHLSADEATALQVGSRHGQPIVLRVAAGEMHRQGFAFFKSDNGVWLTGHVPPAFFSFDRNA